ncbi:MAG: hydantoinase B/oxoprolinase family protein [Acidobacteriota bacterium]|nr:hydantoinase B/oxoprolinase family protein [Acidobacteriota bacterium]
MWRIAVDTGGTFTDALGIDPDGHTHIVKILSHGALRGELPVDASPDADPATQLRRSFPRALPRDFFREFSVHWLGTEGVGRRTFELRTNLDVPLLAAHLLTGVTPGDPLPALELRLATTLGTNALLERRGVRVAFFVTDGFEDLLLIGDQQRPELFTLDVRRDPPLYARAIAVDERVAADGSILRPLSTASLDDSITTLLAEGIDVAAVALLHGDIAPDHERRLADYLRRRGFRHVSRSGDLSAGTRLLPRSQTTVVDAYLAPLLNAYLERVARSVTGGRLTVMTSAGGLLVPDQFRAKDSLLSGPAGGVVGAAAVGRKLGFDRVISFDMGGTSTDVARWDGDFQYRYAQRIAGREILAPALKIETVAAGGGSICHLEGRRLQVGPRSAGADPGPACYGSGGPLTITDVNLLLGYLDPTRFDIPIHVDAAGARLDELCAALREAGEVTCDRHEILLGLREIADEHMAAAIRRISVREGYDPADFVLVAFGGAGGQHATGVADRLGIKTVLVPDRASVLSAEGVLTAAHQRFAERQLLERLEDCLPRLPRLFDELEHEACGTDHPNIRRRTVHARFMGQDDSLEIPYLGGTELAQRFEACFAKRYGHRPEDRSIEVEMLRVVASADPDEIVTTETQEPATPEIDGPDGIDGLHTRTWIDTGWQGRRLQDGSVRITRGATHAESGTRPQAAQLELFQHRFTAIVREMGERLERTAISTNVKERLDFSCALLDPEGQLVVNAPHIPVHLGALGLCVRRLMDTLEMQEGDTVVTNHPAFGGSHLPDVTLVTPVFHEGQRVGFVANRAHHAEIGGTRPGSMPPDATSLSEEGVVLSPLLLVRRGVADWKTITRLLTDSSHPTRKLSDNLADLRAALASNQAGVLGLQRLLTGHGTATVLRYMRDLAGLVEREVRVALRSLGAVGTVLRAKEQLDDGAPIRVAIEIGDDATTIDFTGSAPVHAGNLNATPAIVRSAVLYVIRLLVDRPLPLNEGLLRSVRIKLPDGMLNPVFVADATRCPAVVGGNVETSQRIVDTLLKALGRAACSQGTMNNVLFGNDDYGYYETIGGGCGATATCDGADGVHSHMTNTRITDPEVLERRYPVRLERFGIRRGSGGDGRRRGGDGLRREWSFLQPAKLSVLCQHRIEMPYGMSGGDAGQCGRQWLVRADGTELRLAARDAVDVDAGDRLIMETPGGGGYGD